MLQIQRNRQAPIQEYWVHTMQNAGGYWHHDGALNRPYALLTSGKVSNFYSNCSTVTKIPRLLELAAQNLLNIYPAVSPQPSIFCGSAYGAITLAYELARQRQVEAWFTAKGDGDAMKLDRFEFDGRTRHVMVVEDVITTFKTTRDSIDAICKKAEGKGGNVIPVVFALVNRTYPFVREVDGFQIVSLIEVVDAQTWEIGNNPFTPGDERVPPVRPKQNWDTLTREYI